MASGVTSMLIPRATTLTCSLQKNRQNYGIMETSLDIKNSKFPYCVVWTPIPFLTWLIPLIGHMGIGTSSGIIRDFAGPFFVSEDNMAFGSPTKYWKLDVTKVQGGLEAWDKAIFNASEIYQGRMHYLLWDNCHSHVALALNLMKYQSSSSWNMFKLGVFMLLYGKYVSVYACLKTWFPFCLIMTVILITSEIALYKGRLFSFSYGL